MIGISLERTGQRNAESRDVGTTLNGVNIIDIRVQVLRIISVIHYRHLDRHSLLLCLEIDDIVEEVRAVTVNIADKLLQTVLGMEHLGACLTRLRVGTQVGERDADTSIEVSELTHTARHDVPLECCCGEDGWIGPELLPCAGAVGITDDLHRIQWLTLLVLLLIDLSVAENLRFHVGGESVDTAHTDTMKSAADLI